MHREFLHFGHLPLGHRLRLVAGLLLIRLFTSAHRL